MATTGRLTADQRAAIIAGRPIIQKWWVVAPNAGHTTSLGRLIGQSGPRTTPSGTHKRFERIIRAGSRTLEVWNPSPNVSNSPKSVMYTFVVANDDGFFFENTASDNAFYYPLPTTYQARPQECYVIHKIYIQLIDGTESELTHMEFEGQITSVIYNDISDSAGNPIPATATITCRQRGAWEELSRVWQIEDSIDIPMTNSTEDFIWTVT